MKTGGLGRPATVMAGVAAACAFGVATPADAAPPAGCHQLDGTVTCQFSFTGSERQLTIPADVTSIHVDATGAAGGSGKLQSSGPPAVSGAGGVAGGDLAVHAGEVLSIEVGGQGGPGLSGSGGAGGFNGGAAGGSFQGGGGGGGASDVRTVSCGASCPGDAASLDSRLLVAGGGGGGAGNTLFPWGGTGGGGAAGASGQDGFWSSNSTGGAHGGGCGTQTAGGAGGAPSCGSMGPNGEPGADGTRGAGGGGGIGAPARPGPGVINGTAIAGGGGGGGGYYGGGGGASAGQQTQCGAAGGGGGSNAVGAEVSKPSTGVAAVGAASGVRITYSAPASSSRTYFVSANGSGTVCAANSQAQPFARIQDALACAGDGDVISVAPSDTAYPGIGTVTANLTIEARSGSTARGVKVDLSQPDNSSGTLRVPAGTSVEVDGLTLDCASHQCANPNVTNQGTLVLRRDAITGAGKAVAVLNVSSGSVPARLSVFGSTIAHNTNDQGAGTTQGAGIEAAGSPPATVTLANTTVADNTSGGSGEGGGIFAGFDSRFTLTNVTITGNTATGQFGGAGIYVPAGSDAGTVVASNTLIAGNTSARGGTDCGGTISDGPGGHNLVADPTGCSGVSDGQNGDLVGVAGPGVSQPANDGGPTDTAALQANSLAIGHGDAATCVSEAVGDRDQRGLARGSASRGSCDIGSYDTAGSGGRLFRTWFVAPGGSGTECAGNLAAHPFARVQDALACASDGDVVQLAPSGSTPYPGVGTVSHNVTIEAAPGADARSVAVDLSQPDNSSGPLSVPASAAVAVDGVTLDCVSHRCAHPNVTNNGTLALRHDEITGAGRAVAVLNLSLGAVAARLTVIDSAIVHNTDAEDLDGGQGGGLYSYGDPSPRVTVANTTIADNASLHSGQGGGILVGPTTTMTLTNVTITGNRATGQFGGGGIYVPDGSSPTAVAMTNTLIAGNTSAHGGTDCQGRLSDAPGWHNLVGDARRCSGQVDGGGNQLGVADARIGSLGYNGGPTETVPLVAGSPAIAGGDSGTCGGRLVGDADQRGVARHSAARNACDIGAYDSGGHDTSAPTITVSAPVDGGHYKQGAVVAADYACSDPDGAGDVKTCRGGALDTSTTGAHTFTVNAADWAGNEASKSVTYTVEAATTLPGGSGGETLSGGSNQPPGGGSGDRRAASADLAVSGHLSLRQLRVGSRVVYTLTTRNRGPSGATSVIASATLPRQLQFVSVHGVRGGRCMRNGRKITCRFASLSAGGTLQVTIVAKAIKSGRARVTLNATAQEQDPDLRNNNGATTSAVVRRAG